MAQAVFNRIEKKYLLSTEQYEQLMDKIQPYITKDTYGEYSIRNIYFDTANDELIRTSIEKPEYKEKFRIRCYNCPTMESDVFLEIKKKYLGVVNKRRIVLPYREVDDYLRMGTSAQADPQIAKEINYCIARHQLRPKLYLAYDRLAFHATDDTSVRITFDDRIRSRWEDLTLRNDEGVTYLLEPGYKLMEVKVSNAMPLWFVHILSELNIRNTSFSKYGRIYQKKMITLQEERRNGEYYQFIDNECREYC